MIKPPTMGQHMATSPASVPYGRTDKLLELIGILALVFMIGMPILYYGDLPDIIPRQFGFDGEPDGEGSKSVIWWVLGIGLLMCAALFVLERFIRRNKKIHEDEISHELEGQREIMVQWLQFNRLFLSCLFAYMIYTLISTANGQIDGFHPFFIPVVIGVILGSTLYFMYMAIQNSRVNK